MFADTNVAIATSYLFPQFRGGGGEYAPILPKDGDTCCIPFEG